MACGETCGFRAQPTWSKRNFLKLILYRDREFGGRKITFRADEDEISSGTWRNMME